MTEALPKLGCYQLVSRLGEGAFAEVYKARDTFLKRAVAVKPALLADQEAYIVVEGTRILSSTTSAFDACLP